ncbi:hypothetical protein J2Y73_005184 [Peribacillus frigoritolerans]|uniref:helix-turn-helix transcriptional regulator n=1 Tax=Peribacillus frigoritolerans TaxID=450367 RepID=UPI00209E0888|nr:hypothetical protein [Peribacillus frigoritolerans]MCP1495153.1 hypothetical protein [Peribacillus frigoritolerans]
MEQVPTWKDIQNKNESRLGFHNETKIKYDQLLYLIENQEWFNKFYVCLGKDDLSQTPKHSLRTYAFFIEELQEFKSRFLSLGQVSKMLNMKRDTLDRWITKGHFGDVEVYQWSKGKRVYDSVAITNNLDNAKLKAEDAQQSAYRNKTKSIPYENYLNEELLKVIDEYIDHRQSLTPMIILNKTVKTAKRFSSKKSADSHRRILHLTFFKITAARCGLKGLNFSLDSYPDLTDTKWSNYDKNSFNLEQFSRRDIDAISQSLAVETFFSRYVPVLIPFIQFYLMKKDKELKVLARKENWDFQKRYLEDKKAEDLQETMLDDLLQITKPILSDNNDEKSFLSREEYVKTFVKVFQKYGIREALMLEFSFRIGLRRFETALVAVEDFWIDDKGYLMKDSGGYGRCYFPEAKSKKTGADKYGILVPETLVDLCNQYLKNVLYYNSPFETHKKFAGKVFEGKFGIKKVYKESHGFFFRRSTNYSNPDQGISGASVGKFLRGIRGELTFLDDNSRRNLSYHNGRHTLNEWVENSIVSKQALRYVDFAADLQMRHKPGRLNLGKQKYRQHNKDVLYKEIIENSIHFPFDLEDLIRWEIKKGYKESHPSTICIENGALDHTTPIGNKLAATRAFISDEEKNALLNKLSEIEQSLNKTKQCPKGMLPTDWLKQRKLWIKEKEMINERVKTFGI